MKTSRMNIFDMIIAKYYQRKMKTKGKKILKSLDNNSVCLKEKTVSVNSQDTIEFDKVSVDSEEKDILLDDDFDPELDLPEDISNGEVSSNSSQVFPYMYDDNSDSKSVKNKIDPSLYVFEGGELPTYHFKERGSRYKYREKEKYRQALCGEDIVWDRVDVTEFFKSYSCSQIVELDYKGKKCGMFIPEYLLSLKFNDTDRMIGIINHPKTYCHFPEDKYEYICQCVAIISEQILELFGKTENYRELIGDLKTFSYLSNAQQKMLIERASAPAYEGDDIEYAAPLVKKEDLELMYKLCSHTLSPSMRRMVESSFDQLESTYRSESSSNILTQISYALNIDVTAKKPGVNKNYNEIFDFFDSKLYGMEELKENLAEFLVSMVYSGQNHFAVCLVGSPGVGKTRFSELVAELFKAKLAYVNCSCNGALAIAGLIKSYSGAQPSKISKALRQEATNDVVLLLDEFDKMTVNDKDGDPYSALLEALGYQRRFGDQFFDDGYTIPFDNVKVICTVNDINKIPDYMLNRFEDVFYCDDYDANYKVAIAKHHLIKKQLELFAIKEGEIVFDDSALYEIANNFCKDKGAREMESYIKKCIRKVIRYWSIGSCLKPTVVDKKFVTENLKKMGPKITNERKMGF